MKEEPEKEFKEQVIEESLSIWRNKKLFLLLKEHISDFEREERMKPSDATLDALHYAVELTEQLVREECNKKLQRIIGSPDECELIILRHQRNTEILIEEAKKSERQKTLDDVMRIIDEIGDLEFANVMGEKHYVRNIRGFKELKRRLGV